MKSTSNEAVQQLWNRIGELWCRLSHPAPRWPINGHYECPACLRRYPVPWANDLFRKIPEPGLIYRGAAAGRSKMIAGAPLLDSATLAARL
jgi:hypothetical protein